MSAGRLVKDARAGLSALAGLGAISQGREAVASWRGLGARARALGLSDLATLMESLAALLDKRGALAHEPDPALADLVLSVHDRVEGLASTLVQWSIERSFS